MTDTVCGDESAPNRERTNILSSFHVPAGNIVDVSAVLRTVEHFDEILFLLLALISRAQKRRVADYIAAPFRGQHFAPIHAQGVAFANIAVGF